MKSSERYAKAALERRHGIITTKQGSILGNLKDPAEYEAAPTTTLKHGLISRLTGGKPKEVK